ncbi:MAG TPA: inositol monophosphatase [Aliidongia sp.]|nr:inositol monophosphatase [Aliidongia sp.]
MVPVDPARCAALLRGIGDQLRAGVPVPAGAGLDSLFRVVRAANGWADAAMRSAFQALHPDIGWAGEASARQAEGLHWIYDPIDGAYHFAQGMPLWSSSLTLVRTGRPIVSFVYDPAQREMFIAEKEARLDGAILRLTAKPDLGAAVLGTALPPGRGPDGALVPAALDAIGRAAGHAFVIRMMASASLQLAYVAAGRLDGYWELGRDIHDWLAGAHLVRAAGGMVSDLVGRDFGFDADGVVAAPAGLHADLLAVLSPGGSIRPAAP